MKKMFFMLTLVMLFLVSCGKDSGESSTGSGEAGKENKKKIKIGDYFRDYEHTFDILNCQIKCTTLINKL